MAQSMHIRTVSSLCLLSTLLNHFKLWFPIEHDSTTFRVKGTEVPLFSQDNETMEQAQEDEGRDRWEQPVKIREVIRDRTVRDFDSLSRPRIKQDRAEKDILKQKKVSLKQKRTF